MLRSALGPAISAYLQDPGVIEVMLNPDGRIWVDRLSEGLSDTGERLSPEDGERIVRLVAHHVGAEVHARSPRVSAELPESGERFEGLLPPVVAAASFAIRKPAVAVFTLDDYVTAGVMTRMQAEALRLGVATRANILVAGGTSTCKTTLTNALLAEVAKTSDRVIIIEDTRELQCAAPNLVAMRTKDGVATLSDLVRSTRASALGGDGVMFPNLDRSGSAPIPSGRRVWQSRGIRISRRSGQLSGGVSKGAAGPFGLGFRKGSAAFPFACWA
jgi:P-type conjugative transfer ATPase TrbB